MTKLKNNVFYYIKQATKYTKKNDTKNAVKNLQRAKKLSVDDYLNKYYEYIKISGENSVLKNAIIVCNNIIESGINIEDCKKIKKELEKLINNNESINTVTYYSDLALQHVHSKQYNRALEYLDKAISLFPKDSSLYYKKGMVYAEKSDYTNSIIECSKAIKLDPNNSEYYYYRAKIYSKNKSDFEKATKDMKKAIELNPDDPEFQKFKDLPTGKINENKVLYHDRIKEILKEDSLNKRDKTELLQKLENYSKFFNDYQKKIIKKIIENIKNPKKWEKIVFKQKIDPEIELIIVYYENYLLRLESVKKAKELLNKEIETQKDMLSFLTHSINNALGTGVETLEDVIDSLKDNNGDKNYNETRRLASLFSGFSIINNMLKTYKIYIQDKNKFRKTWKKDIGNEMSMKEVLLNALRLNLANLFFVESASNTQNFIQNNSDFIDRNQVKEVSKSIKKSFITEVLTDNSNTVEEWIISNLNFIDINIEKYDIYFSRNNIKSGIFFAIFNELISNAFKYSDKKDKIKIRLYKESDNYIFTCSNSITDNSLNKEFSSGRGLKLIEHLLSYIKDDDELISKNISDNNFTITINIPTSEL